MASVVCDGGRIEDPPPVPSVRPLGRASYARRRYALPGGPIMPLYEAASTPLTPSSPSKSSVPPSWPTATPASAASARASSLLAPEPPTRHRPRLLLRRLHPRPSHHRPG